MNPDRFFASIALAGFFSAIAYFAGKLMGGVMVARVQKSSGADALKALIDSRSELERKFAHRIGELRRAMALVDRDLKVLGGQRQRVEAELSHAESCPDRIVRVVGQEVKGNRLHVALVINKYAKSGGGKALTDPAWATAQEIEVWAKTLAEARSELDRTYPESQGFKVTNLVEPA